MVNLREYTRKYNTKNLAAKDPFNLNSINLISGIDKIEYYSGIISSCILKIMEATEGFDQVSYNPCGSFVVGRYYFNKDKTFSLKEYFAGEDSERFHKGDNIIVTSNVILEQKVKYLFDIFREIEDNNWIDTNLPKFDFDEIHLNIVTDISSLSYFRPRETKPFFVFDYYHPDERKQVIRKMTE